MAIESATYISQLNSNNPAGTDLISQADDHIRLLKSTIQATFPNFSANSFPMSADVNGAVTIPAPSAGGALTINGKSSAACCLFQAAAATDAYAIWNTSGSAVQYQLAAKTDGSFTLRDNVAGADRAVISTLGALRLNAYGAGTLTTDASGNVTAASDERIKSNIRPFTRGLDDVLRLNPILHGYKADSNLDQSRDDYAGFSAQNVRESIPEAVSEMEPAGILSLSDRPLIAALVNAVKELSARVIELENRA